MNKIAQVFGQVNPPYSGQYLGSGGITNFISNIIRFMIVAAGIYAVFNLVFAGYSFMSAGGDAKKVADSWAKIWQTLLGLAIAAGAFVLAAIFGQLIFGDFQALLQFRVYGP